jgi:hypothetical protein
MRPAIEAGLTVLLEAAGPYMRPVLALSNLTPASKPSHHLGDIPSMLGQHMKPSLTIRGRGRLWNEGHGFSALDGF